MVTVIELPIITKTKPLDWRQNKPGFASMTNKLALLVK